MENMREWGANKCFLKHARCTGIKYARTLTCLIVQTNSINLDNHTSYYVKLL